jgi:hypothetical protein
MFYSPNRSQAIKVQETLKTLYQGVGGEYYVGNDAWNYILAHTNIDLLQIFTRIAEENRKV